MVTLLRVLRIVILIRIFRLASQKKQLEVVTRRMVSWCLIYLGYCYCFQLSFSRQLRVVSHKTAHSILVCN